MTGLGDGGLVDAETGWQPMHTAPRDGTRILLRRIDRFVPEARCDTPGDTVVVGRFYDGRWEVDWDQNPFGKADQWAPLPYFEDGKP